MVFGEVGGIYGYPGLVDRQVCLVLFSCVSVSVSVCHC